MLLGMVAAFLAPVAVDLGFRALVSSAPVAGYGPWRAALLLARHYPIDKWQALAVVALAMALGADFRDLAAVINYETAGTWSTTIVNEHSGAIGLIQFTPRTIRELGTTEARVRAMDFYAQLSLAGEYWRRARDGEHWDDPRPLPLDSFQSVAMAVFHPPARDWPVNRRFSARILEGNPHVPTVGHYLRAVRSRAA